MARYQIILAYDGTNFYGVQRLKSGCSNQQRTVQIVVEDALRHINWQGRTILIAGRTDTGVHASGQVIAFDLDWPHSHEKLLRALNARLPKDVSALQIQVVAPDFHPRYDARARLYLYRIFCQEMRDPLKERYAWRIWPALDVRAMNLASSYLTGIHDFAAFGKPLKAGASTTRNVVYAGWKEYDRSLVFLVLANAFLYRMVRRMVYLLVAIGQGKALPEDVPVFMSGSNQNYDVKLIARKLSKVQGLAPAYGLDLAKVYYRDIHAEEFYGMDFIIPSLIIEPQ